MALGAKTGSEPIDLVYDSRLLLDAQRRGLEAFMTAGRIVADGFRACAERQLDMAQVAAREFWADFERARSNGSPELNTAELVDRFRASLERTAANARELSDIVLKAQGEALTVLSAYVTDTFDAIGKAGGTVVEAANKGTMQVSAQPAAAEAPKATEVEKAAEDGARRVKRATASDAA